MGMITDFPEVLPKHYHSRLKLNRENIFSPDSYLSKSSIWELNSRSLFAWRYYPEEKKNTDAMLWGSLIDCLTTTPDEVDEVVSIGHWDTFRSDAAKEWKQEQLELGNLPILEKWMDDALLAAKMLTEVHPISSELFSISKTQVVLLAKWLGVNVKGLVDLAPVGKDYLVDEKTCHAFSKEGFEKTMANFGYHVQFGAYLALWNHCFPNDKRTRFKVIWQSSSYPFEVAVTEVAVQDIESGYKYFEHMLKRVTEAAKLDHWPMAFPKEDVILRPTWAAINEEEKIKSDVPIEETHNYKPNQPIQKLI